MSSRIGLSRERERDGEERLAITPAEHSAAYTDNADQRSSAHTHTKHITKTATSAK